MERTGFYNKGIEGAEAIDPSKITAGQKYDTGLVYIYPATNNAIDDVNALYTGWIIFNESVNRWQEAGNEAIQVIDNLTSTSTTSALSANQGRVLNLNKEPVFAKNNAFNKNFGTTVETVTRGNDSRHVIKRINVSIGSSAGNKKGVSFAYGTSIFNPFFSLAITSSNNNDAFCVKVIQITTISAYLEVYRADGSSWGDVTLACMVTIYSGTY